MPSDPSASRPAPSRENSYLPFSMRSILNRWSSSDSRSSSKASRGFSRNGSPTRGRKETSDQAFYANLMNDQDSDTEIPGPEEEDTRKVTGSRQGTKEKKNPYEYDENNDDDDDFQPLPPPPPVQAPPLHRTYSPSPRPTPPPFQPPPLTPLTLEGLGKGEGIAAQILSSLIASEIRLLLPGRLELVDTWRLTFSLERDGASLSTLYDRCDDYTGRRGGFVLVVRDTSGNIFGSYLSDPPAPSKGHYYGNGECFLWRSTVLSSMSLQGLPPPPSADTTHATRSTTLGLAPPQQLQQLHNQNRSGASTPERIRFRAFPYSGENDYMIFCESGFLSVGGGDGHYGLWLDSALERGVSGPCPTFGNEPLSDEGEKFEVMGVEVWYVGATS